MKWTVENIEAIAKEYTTRHQFRMGNFAAYRAAKRKGIFEDVIKHMPPSKTIPKWNVESLRKIALQYKTISEFRTTELNAYNAASRLKLMAEITTHMEEAKWTVIRIAETANKCGSKKEFRREYRAAYRAASDLGILQAVTKNL